MKLKNKKKTGLLIALIAALVVVVIAITTVIVVSVINKENEQKQEEEQKNAIREIVIVTSPKTEYYVGEELNLEGLKVQVVTGDFETTYFVEYPNNELTITGFDSTTAGTKVITVQYKEFTTTFNVLIKDYPTGNPTLTAVEVKDMFLEYTVEEWQSWGPSELNAWLLLTYSDGSTKGSLQETPLRRGYITGWNPNNVYTPGETQITITYTEDGVTVSTTVTITITE